MTDREAPTHHTPQHAKDMDNIFKRMNTDGDTSPMRIQEPSSEHPIESESPERKMTTSMVWDTSTESDPMEAILKLASSLSSKTEWTAWVAGIEQIDKDLDLTLLKPKVSEFCQVMLNLSGD